MTQADRNIKIRPSCITAESAASAQAGHWDPLRRQRQGSLEIQVRRTAGNNARHGLLYAAMLRKNDRASAADSSRISTMFFPRYRWDNAASLYRFPPQSGQVFSDRKRFRRFHVLSRCSSGPFIRHSRWNWFLIPSIFLCSLGPSGVRLPYSRRFCSSGV